MIREEFYIDRPAAQQLVNSLSQMLEDYDTILHFKLKIDANVIMLIPHVKAIEIKISE